MEIKSNQPNQKIKDGLRTKEKKRTLRRKRSKTLAEGMMVMIAKLGIRMKKKKVMAARARKTLCSS